MVSASWVLTDHFFETVSISCLIEHSDAQSDQEENAKDQDKRKGATIEKDGNNEKKDENTGNDTNQRQLRRVGQ